MQLQLLKKTAHGFRYSTAFKQFALTIFFVGPKVYKFLLKTLRLPSRAKLYRITSKWTIASGCNDVLFTITRTKVSMMKDEAKDTVLCEDEMSLKTFLFYDQEEDEIIGFHETVQKTFQVATHALVVMARGIHCNWKYPVAYFLCNYCRDNRKTSRYWFECAGSNFLSRYKFPKTYKSHVDVAKVADLWTPTTRNPL